jgi:hypothetical protein
MLPIHGKCYQSSEVRPQDPETYPGMSEIHRSARYYGNFEDAPDEFAMIGTRKVSYPEDKTRTFKEGRLFRYTDDGALPLRKLFEYEQLPVIKEIKTGTASLLDTTIRVFAKGIRTEAELFELLEHLKWNVGVKKKIARVLAMQDEPEKITMAEELYRQTKLQEKVQKQVSYFMKRLRKRI